ncbi:MAG TPA: FAD-dependent oxidoreductase, partial [Clostridia bacterium]|nr:FAD-dependent oxidoreductase [Clostridia bacterium]
ELPRETEFIGSGVSYCATCDGAFFRGKAVAVVGGGNTAVQDALYLERFASEIYIIHRRDELRATKILAERIKASQKVHILWDSAIKSLEGENKLSSIKLVNLKTKAESEIAVNGLFVAIGQVPSTSFAEIDKDNNGYILTQDDMSTNIAGVFAAGDLRHKPLRQVVTACADGAIAAESASKWLVEENR